MCFLPPLSYPRLKDTLQTLHLWTQIVGKIRLSQMPWVNHQWHTTLYVSPCGLTTGTIPSREGVFDMEFDFEAQDLIVRKSDGREARLELKPRSVAEFYEVLHEKLEGLGLDISMHGAPNEIEPAIPFIEDTTNRNYEGAHAREYWMALCEVHKVFTKFRARFKGKCSPVHFFWGAFDLAVTRFSGRSAPLHPAGAPNMPDRIMQEAYSDELSSCGFWPGSDDMPEPMFYAYCYPVPENFGKQPLTHEKAFYSEKMGEYFLPYEAVQLAKNPQETLLDFLETTYEDAAITLNWDRDALDFHFRP